MCYASLRRASWVAGHACCNAVCREIVGRQWVQGGQLLHVAGFTEAAVLPWPHSCCIHNSSFTSHPAILNAWWARGVNVASGHHLGVSFRISARQGRACWPSFYFSLRNHSTFLALELRSARSLFCSSLLGFLWLLFYMFCIFAWACPCSMRLSNLYF